VLEDALTITTNETQKTAPPIVDYLASLKKWQEHGNERDVTVAVRPLAEEEEESSEIEGDADGQEDGNTTTPIINLKKRSSVHLDGELQEDGPDHDDEPHLGLYSRGDTPPKRVRLQGAFTGATKVAPGGSPHRKRSSEEADEDDVHASSEERGQQSPSRGSYKRMKREDRTASPASSGEASPPQTSTPIPAESEEDIEVMNVRIRSRKYNDANAPRLHEPCGGSTALDSPTVTARRSSSLITFADTDK
jgi:hypothetical protein